MTAAIGAPPGLGAQWIAVSHDYGTGPVLQDVTLSIDPGESVALLGANGAGKTTLTRMLMGLVHPRAGSVRVGDWDVAGRRPDEMARRVGYAFQHADQQLFARTVREDVAFGPRRIGIADDDGVDAVLDELALGALKERHPYDLPAPVRKLVTLAGVLAMRPGLCVLDEPTAGFDRDLRARVVAAIQSRLRDGVTVLYVSHDHAFVDAVARRRVTLDAGRVAADVRS